MCATFKHKKNKKRKKKKYKENKEIPLFTCFLANSNGTWYFHCDFSTKFETAPISLTNGRRYAVDVCVKIETEIKNFMNDSFVINFVFVTCDSYYQWQHEHPNELFADRVEDGIPTLKHHSLHLTVHQCPYVSAYAFLNCHCPHAAMYSLFCSPIVVLLADESIWQVHDEFVLQLWEKVNESKKLNDLIGSNFYQKNMRVTV